MEKIPWKLFRSRYLKTGDLWMHRRKTYRALRTLWERMPAEDMAKLPSKGLLVLAPSPLVDGQTVHLLHQESVIVYLSPELERRPQSYADLVVANEFAHVVLGVSNPSRTLREWAAEDLSARWGYPLPYEPT